MHQRMLALQYFGGRITYHSSLWPMRTHQQPLTLMSLELHHMPACFHAENATSCMVTREINGGVAHMHVWMRGLHDCCTS
jgi:hypothetical protein